MTYKSIAKHGKLESVAAGIYFCTIWKKETWNYTALGTNDSFITVSPGGDIRASLEKTLAPCDVIDSGSVIRDRDVYRQRLQLQIERKGEQKNAKCERTFKPPCKHDVTSPEYGRTVFFRENKPRWIFADGDGQAAAYKNIIDALPLRSLAEIASLMSVNHMLVAGRESAVKY